LGSFDELRQRTDADALAILKEATNPKYKSDTDQRPLICIKRY
jgi:endothelin-converting enzyme/putative endopeptidase